MKALALLMSFLCIGGSLQAQTVYRCGPDGRVYSQSPCPQGRAVDVSDERSTEQRAAAQARARDDQLRGDALERERLDREAGKPVAAGKIGKTTPAAGPVASKTKAKSSKKKKKAQQAGDDFKAIAPTPAKKTKSRS